MGASCFLREAAAALAGLFLLAGAPAALAAGCSTEEEALAQFQGLVQAAVEQMNAEEAPAVLQKDRVGLVLVARAAPSRTTDQNALRRDINALSQQLTRPPGEVCRAVERIRTTHGL